jgi:hypothetical protein
MAEIDHSPMVANVRDRRVGREAPSAGRWTRLSLRTRETATLNAARAWTSVVLIGYLLLVGFGATTSSLGVPPLRDDPSQDAPGLVGEPDMIRSDEFLRTTPWRLGLLKTGGDDFGSTLSYPDPALVTNGDGGVVSSTIFPDTVLLLLSPDSLNTQAFAALWWLPVLLVLLLLPRWLGFFGVGLAIAAPVTLLVVLSPVTIWWSWMPLIGLGWALLSAVAAASGIMRWRRGQTTWLAAALLVLAGLSLARLGLSYQPWAIPLGATVLIPTVTWLISSSRRAWKQTTALSLAVLLIAVAVLAGFLAEHRGALSVLADTAYPGSRRFAGSTSNLAELFGAPHLWRLWDNPTLTATNPSEISTGFSVLALVCIALVPAVEWRSLPGLTPPVVSLSAVLVAMATWCTIDWPDRASGLFPASLISPGRLVQVIGISATLMFALMISAWARAPRGRRLPTTLTATSIAFFATAMGGSVLRQLNMPSLRTVSVAAVSLLTAGAIAVAVANATRRWAMLPAVLLAAAVVALVNPLQVGFGALRDGHAARYVVTATDGMEAGDRWASDDFFMDALLMANGASALSGQQWIGPRERQWRKIDPSGRYRNTWNRGAAYVVFAWEDEGARTVVELPSPDVILIKIDPCSRALSSLRLGLVVSSTPLDASCLRLRSRLDFGGRAHWIYSAVA